MLPTYGYIWYMNSHSCISTYSETIHLKFDQSYMHLSSGKELFRDRGWPASGSPQLSRGNKTIFCPDLTLSLLSLPARDFCLRAWNQSCELRRQKNSTCTRPSFREIWKVSSLSLLLSGKKGSPRPSPRSSFPRPPHAENEPSIAVRGSRPPPPHNA